MESLTDFFSNINFQDVTFDADYMWAKVIPALNEGIWVSFSLIVPSIILGFVFGTLIGSVRVFGSPRIKKAADIYTLLVRGVPLIVQLFILYYGLPSFGISLKPYTAAVLGFTMCSAAYHSEYIRGALLSIKQGQIKAAQALGFSSFKSILWIIVPQALRRALPGCSNEFIYLIKYSSLASAIVIMELTGKASSLANMDYKYAETFLPLGAYYLFITSLATLLVYFLEKKLAIPGFGARNLKNS